MIYIISKSSFFLYLIVCIIFLYCKSIKLNYYAINDQFNLKLYIGTPPEGSFIPIDLNLDFSWITSQIFSPTNSKTSHFQNVIQINDRTDIKKEIVEIIDHICVAFTGAGLPPKDCFTRRTGPCLRQDWTSPPVRPAVYRTDQPCSLYHQTPHRCSAYQGRLCLHRFKRCGQSDIGKRGTAAEGAVSEKYRSLRQGDRRERGTAVKGAL